MKTNKGEQGGERGLKIGNLEQKHFSKDPKHKKDKIVTLSFPKFVSFHHLSVQEELRISEIFFAILLTKILTDKRKGAFLFLWKTKR